MKVGVAMLGHGTSLVDLAEAARAAEAAGLHSVWVGEYHRNAYVSAAVIAQATSTVSIGTAIALAFPRSPLVTAMAALDLDELSGGRFRLGLGSQVKGIIERWHAGTFERPAKRLGEYAEAVRYAMERTEHPFAGDHYPMDLRGFDRPLTDTRPPVLIAGLGPLMVKTATRSADGLLGHMLWSERYFDEVVRPALAQARPGFHCTVSVISAFDDDREAARADARRTVGFYAATGTYAGILADDGFEKEAARAREAFASRDLRGLEAAVPDEMLDMYAIAGDRDDFLRLMERRAARYDELILVDAHYGTPQERLAQHRAALLENAPHLVGPW